MISCWPQERQLFSFRNRGRHCSRLESGVNATTAIIKVDNSQVPNKNKGAVYKGATIAKLMAGSSSLRTSATTVSTFSIQTSSRCASPSSSMMTRSRRTLHLQRSGYRPEHSCLCQTGCSQTQSSGRERGLATLPSLAQMEGSWRICSTIGSSAPWGVVITSLLRTSENSVTILVGNFRGGTIAAFNPLTGKFIGNMLDSGGAIVNIDGLWALVFGNGGASGPGSTLFFTAGPDNRKRAAYFGIAGTAQLGTTNSSLSTIHSFQNHNGLSRNNQHGNKNGGGLCLCRFPFVRRHNTECIIFILFVCDSSTSAQVETR